MEITPQQKIHLLPEHIIDQIKAGEVIERPSTLLKEIIENSIDAKSTKIDLHIINNGIDLISIEDNGVGINGDDLPMAFCRHATSKIDRFEDIYRLHSYGFRGEALASIASISRINCQSQTTQSKSQIKIEGGLTLLHQSEDAKSIKTGTKIYIKDLFYNTPVRMKFIQSQKTEKNQINKIINAFLLTQPQIHFSIKWDDHEKLIYPAQLQLQDRVKDVFFKKKEVQLLETNNQYDGVNFKVLLSKESNRGNAHKFHYLFINERFVQDIQLHKVILNSAFGLWPDGETGHYIAFLDLPTDEVDVNIHPNKTIVKLFQVPKVLATVSGSIKQLLSKQLPKESHSSLTNSSHSSLEFDLSTSATPSLEYKEIDFNQKQEVDTYLQNIHTQVVPVVEKSFSSFIKHQNHCLFQFTDILYITESYALQGYELKSILLNNNYQTKQAPLLISKPIRLLKKINHQTLKFINSLGYEVDFLAENTLVIRSFPEAIQKFPYISLIENIIKHDWCELPQINFSLLNYSELTIHRLKYILDKFSLSHLIKEEVINIITVKELDKLYAYKK